MQEVVTDGWSNADSFLLAVLVALVVGAAWWWCSGADRLRRAGLVAFATAALIPLWVNGAVGIVGNEDNPDNLLFLVVSAFGVFGAVLVKFRTAGLVRTAQLAAGLHIAVVGLLWLRGAEALPLAALLLALPWLLAAELLKRSSGVVAVDVPANAP